MNDDEFNAADAGIDPGGIHNDLKLCLQQALEYLETGEHDGGWVALKTIDVECALELVEAVALPVVLHFGVLRCGKLRRARNP
jgi:hypothetical protein